MAKTTVQFAEKISKACAGQIKHLSPNGAIIETGDKRLISVNGPTELDPALRAQAQTILNTERLYATKVGFAYYLNQPSRPAYVPSR